MSFVCLNVFFDKSVLDLLIYIVPLVSKEDTF
jgi:hypothetical protein